MRDVDWFEEFPRRHPGRHLGTILKYICDKHQVTRQDFIVLLEVAALKEFTWNDFATAELTASWDKRRFYRWKDEGLIETYREKDGRFRKYNIYRCTRKTKGWIKEFYDLLSGKEQLPTTSFSENFKYSSNRLTKKINKLKENGTT